MASKIKFDCGCEFYVSDDRKSVEWKTSEIRLDCPKVWTLMKKGLTGCVFQLNKELGQSYSAQLQPSSIEEWSDLIALIRPGCLEAKDADGKNITQHYIDRKFGIEPEIAPHPLMAEFLNQTRQCPIYQEDAMRTAQDIADYSGPESYDLIKAIGKKKPELMAKHKKMFKKQCLAKGLTEEDFEQIFNTIESSQRYSFNRCLSEDTIVETKRGKIELKNIKVGDFVRDHLGDLSKVSAIMRHGEKETLECFLESGKSIKCSKHHKFLTNEGILPLSTILERRAFASKEAQPKIICRDSQERILTTRYIGKTKLMDITVDNDDHLFLANDIVTSNSHAVSYALDGYIYSAFVKAHFPRAFYCAELDFAKDHDKKAIVIEDALKLGIETLLPDIRYWNKNFNILDKNLLFGLTQVKFVSESTINSLKEICPKIWECGWAEILNALANIKSDSAQALIKSGAFDWLRLPRSLMLYELNIFSQLNCTQKAYIRCTCKSLKEGLQKIVDGGSGKDTLCYNILSLKKVQKLLTKLENPASPLIDTPKEIIEWEQQYLGKELSACRTNELELRQPCYNCNEVFNLRVPLRRIFHLPIVLAQWRVYQTKKNQEMCWLKGYDLTGSLNNIVMFSGVWDEYKNKVIENATFPLLLRGKMNNYNRQWSFMVQEIIE